MIWAMGVGKWGVLVCVGLCLLWKDACIHLDNWVYWMGKFLLSMKEGRCPLGAPSNWISPAVNLQPNLTWTFVFWKSMNFGPNFLGVYGFRPKHRAFGGKSPISMGDCWLRAHENKRGKLKVLLCAKSLTGLESIKLRQFHIHKYQVRLTASGVFEALLPPSAQTIW